jgi:hypothetical protein
MVVVPSESILAPHQDEAIYVSNATWAWRFGCAKVCSLLLEVLVAVIVNVAGILC